MQFENEPETQTAPKADVPDKPSPRARWGRTATLYLASALSAGLFTLAAPPYDQGWLAWLAPAPFFWALLRCALGVGPQGLGVGKGTTDPPTPKAQHRTPNPSLRHAAGVGFVHGFSYLLLLAPWFAAFSPAGYPVAGIYWGLLSAVIATGMVAAARRVPLALVPAVLASGWTVLEWLRAQGTLTFPWGTLAASQYKNIIVLQMLDLTGAYGLTFLIALIAASLAAALQAFGRCSVFGVRCSESEGQPAAPEHSNNQTAEHLPEATQGDPRAASQHRTPDTEHRTPEHRTPNTEHRTPSLLLANVGLHWGVVSLVVLGALMLRGGWVLAQSKRPTTTARVAVVQASESRKVSGVAVECVSPFEDYEARTKEAASKGAELILWPESACQGDAANDRNIQERLAKVLWKSKSHLLAGSFVDVPLTGETTNSAVMLSPQGRVLGQYAKVLIVPFGEYLPLRPLLRWTERLGMPSEDLLAGKQWTPLSWTRGRVGVSICFESAFGAVSRAHVRQGANLLAVLTSDGWAGRKAAGLQHASFAPLRAVETRRSVARAAATGVSQLIDPYGRPHRALPMFTKGVAVVDLPLRSDLTPFVQLGDWPVGLSWLLLAGLPLARALAGRRRPRRVA